MRIGFYAPELNEMAMSSDAGYTPYAKWGVVECEEDGMCHIQPYRLRSFDLFDGIPQYKFQTDEKWTRLPKNWTYATDLLESRRTHDDAGFNECYEWMKSCRIDDPNAYIEGIEKGFLITDMEADIHVESEVAKGLYRLVRKATPWMHLGSFAIPSFKVFDNYNDALTQAEGLVAETKHKAQFEHSADVMNDIQFVLDRVPDEHRKEVEFLLWNTNFPYGFALRYYNGRVLLRETMKGAWKTIWSVPK